MGSAVQLTQSIPEDFHWELNFPSYPKTLCVTTEGTQFQTQHQTRVTEKIIQMYRWVSACNHFLIPKMQGLMYSIQLLQISIIAWNAIAWEKKYPSNVHQNSKHTICKFLCWLNPTNYIPPKKHLRDDQASFGIPLGSCWVGLRPTSLSALARWWWTQACVDTWGSHRVTSLLRRAPLPRQASFQEAGGGGGVPAGIQTPRPRGGGVTDLEKSLSP